MDRYDEDGGDDSDNETDPEQLMNEWLSELDSLAVVSRLSRNTSIMQSRRFAQSLLLLRKCIMRVCCIGVDSLTFLNNKADFFVLKKRFSFFGCIIRFIRIFVFAKKYLQGCIQIV